MSKLRRQKALLVGGYSESREFTKYLVEALKDPHDGLFHNVYYAPVNESLEFPEGFRQAATDSDLISHSAGIVPIKRHVEAAQSITALAAPEPTSLLSVVIGGAKVALETKDNPESHVDTGTLLDPAAELMNYPEWALRIPFIVDDFSTAEFLIGAEDRFPDGRAMVQYSGDQFGFTQDEYMQLAADNGVMTRLERGLHNTPMTQPKRTVAILNDLYYNQSQSEMYVDNS